jgi:hypothetical protein
MLAGEAPALRHEGAKARMIDRCRREIAGDDAHAAARAVAHAAAHGLERPLGDIGNIQQSFASKAPRARGHDGAVGQERHDNVSQSSRPADT